MKNLELKRLEKEIKEEMVHHRWFTTETTEATEKSKNVIRVKDKIRKEDTEKNKNVFRVRDKIREEDTINNYSTNADVLSTLADESAAADKERAIINEEHKDGSPQRYCVM